MRVISRDHTAVTLNTDLFSALEYCLRAQRMRADGFSSLVIEQCTGIPSNLQPELLPSIANEILAAGRVSSLSYLASVMPEDDIRTVMAAQHVRRNIYRSLPFRAEIGAINVPLDAAQLYASEYRLSSSLKERVARGWMELERHPLPLESSLSMVCRLTAENLVDGPDAVDLLGIATSRTKGYLGRKIDIRLHKVSEALAVHSTVDAQLIANLPHLSGVLFHDRFRFCPECLGVRYHSVLHQLTAVSECLLHEAPLMDHCIHCERATGTIGSVVARGQSAFACEFCAGFLGNEEPSEEGIRVFRQAMAEYEAHLRPWRSWFEIAQATLWPLEQILDQNESSLPSWYAWCDPRETMLTAALRLHPLPESSHDGKDFETNLLHWAQRMRRFPPRGRIRRRQRDAPSGAYFATLRRLSESYSLASNVSDRRTLAFGDALATDGRDLLEIALTCTRMHIEKSTGKLITGRSDRLGIDFAAFMHQSQDRAPRAQMSALTLGAVGTMLAAITKDLQTRDFLSASTFRAMIPQQMVPLALLPRADDIGRTLRYCEGVALCPTSKAFEPTIVGGKRWNRD
ncbi:TniQ family protein [Caballeronia sp. LjRoot34]|uniref:TniQ family protein n=1 Tax=Caballeronia sp. LjRoot34 TaxID=3342325 RepID=UPI003ECF618F